MTGLLFECQTPSYSPYDYRGRVGLGTKALEREEMGKREREGNEISFLFFNHNVLFWKRFKS